MLNSGKILGAVKDRLILGNILLDSTFDVVKISEQIQFIRILRNSFIKHSIKDHKSVKNMLTKR